MDVDYFVQMTPKMPPELLVTVPRRVRLSADSRYKEIVLWMMLALTIILSIWVSRGAAEQIRMRSTLRHDGVEARGEITEIKSVPRSQDIVSYSFPANGETFLGKAGVPPQLMHRLRESKSIAVRYLPSNPGINHPAEWEWSLWSSSIEIIFLMIFVLLFSASLSAIYRRLQVISQGKPAVGVVTKCGPAGGGAFSLKYEFCTETGMRVGGIGYSRVSQEIGVGIWILFLPQSPSRSLPYPVPGCEVEY